MEESCPVREQDKFLPIANISRIMKEALPHNAKVSKDAKELVQNCVSDFIIYITSQCAFRVARSCAEHLHTDRRYGPHTRTVHVVLRLRMPDEDCCCGT